MAEELTQDSGPAESSWAAGRWLRDLRLATAFLTLLPLGPSRGAGGAGELAAASWAFPLAGALVGLIAGLGYALARGLGLPPFLAAALAVAVSILVTGALHEDGLADLADGLGVRGGLLAKLAAMRASGIGGFGALALIVSVLLRVAALAALGTTGPVLPALIAAHAGGRALLPWALYREPRARADGLAVNAGRPGRRPALFALLIGFVLLFLATGPVHGVIAAAAALLALLLLPLARRQIGGITGDVLGAVEQTAEIVILLVLVAGR
jgi:adenosylcobinamide-GDP ribazoletransferase